MCKYCDETEETPIYNVRSKMCKECQDEYDEARDYDGKI